LISQGSGELKCSLCKELNGGTKGEPKEGILPPLI